MTSGRSGGTTSGTPGGTSSGTGAGMSDETSTETGTETSTEIVSALRAVGAVAILRLTDHRLIVDVGRALYDAGLTAMEITFDHPAAPDALRELRSALPETALLGAGTV